MFLYKRQILTSIKLRPFALHHAAPSVLNTIDRVQRRFLREINMYETETFRIVNLAPLPVRLDISMLSLLYKIARVLTRNALANLVPRHIAKQLSTRDLNHEFQFKDFVQQNGHTDENRKF